MAESLRAALLISGGGTTAQEVIKATRDGRLNGIVPTVVIASNTKAGGIERAKRLNVKIEIRRPRDFKSSEAFGESLLEMFIAENIDVIGQLGWLAWTPNNVLDKYKGRIFNQHSGPLDGKRPGFGGEGMYGLRVHLALLAFAWISGIPIQTEATTHHAIKEVDEGEIIRRLPLDISGFMDRATEEELKSDPIKQQQLVDAAKNLQATLLPIEHRNVINTFRDFVSGSISVFKRTTPLIAVRDLPTLAAAKQLAVQMSKNL